MENISKVLFFTSIYDPNILRKTPPECDNPLKMVNYLQFWESEIMSHIYMHLQKGCHIPSLSCDLNWDIFWGIHCSIYIHIYSLCIQHSVHILLVFPIFIIEVDSEEYQYKFHCCLNILAFIVMIMFFKAFDYLVASYWGTYPQENLAGMKLSVMQLRKERIWQLIEQWSSQNLSKLML